jgi:hypothetical protein
MSNQFDSAKGEPLQIIVGNQLSSVEFVQDYVQLRFDGPSLTAITQPRVLIGDVLFEWGSPGYRDALCERIGKIVSAVALIEMQDIKIEFNDGSCVSISLRPADYRAAEAAIFRTEPDNTWVW